MHIHAAGSPRAKNALQHMDDVGDRRAQDDARRDPHVVARGSNEQGMSVMRPARTAAAGSIQIQGTGS
jgi:hypothetical protein